ncbi:MAG: aminotransferase class IV, partial [Deltaproteobacteria bacterium]|nr:aminotransferase class IV [Deltaproteobacteria bacterium]
VHVPSLLLLEKYPTVWQMTSTVRARTYEPLDRIFQALFPPASITGAPKRRTMEIIAEMESSPRRAYTGAIGFAAPGRRAQFNVAIRTILIHKASGCAEYGVGGGIVWDSDCEMEQSECATKARILLASFDSAFFLLESLLRLSSGGFHLLERHLERIEKSAEYFDWPVNLEEVRRQLLDLSQNLPPSPHKVRLLLSKNGCIECQAEPVTLPSPISRRKIALAHFPVNKSNPFLYHKTTNREVYEEALSKCPEYDDVILFNEDGEVTESTRANVLVEMDGNLYTPPVRCGLLAGTCRAWMLELRVIEERTITIDQLLQSRSVFLINSVRGMYRVTIDRDKRERPSERDPKAVLQ